MAITARPARQAAAALLALAVVGGAAHADVLVDCKESKASEVRMRACSEIIASKTVVPAVRAEAYRNRAAAYSVRAAAKEAIADYSEALLLDPASGQAYIGRGQARLAVQDIDGAIADLTQATRLNGQSAGLFVARGYARLLKGESGEAINDFSSAIQLDPKDAGAYNNRGLAYRKKGDLANAVVDYSSAIRLNPVYAQAYANRGYVYEAQGNRPPAVADFRRALTLDPSLTGAANGLKRLGEPPDALAQSDKLIAQGQVLAQKNCAWCHAIGRTGDSPNPRAPRWRDLAKRHPILALREPLSRGIVRPHDEMPKFELSDDEIDTIVAYINSLPP